MSEELEQLRYTAARRAWSLDRSGNKPEKFDSWAQWWGHKYGDGQTLNEYVEEKRREIPNLRE